jgi:hypothetical protein
MRISRRKHNAKALAGLGRESVLFSGTIKTHHLGNGAIRLYGDNGTHRDPPPTRFFVDLTELEIQEIIEAYGVKNDAL